MGAQGPARLALKILLGIALALVVLVVGSLLLLDEGRLADEVTRRALPSLSAQLGREIRIGSTDVELVPLVVSVEQVWVEGEREEPLIVAKRARVRIALWPLLTSFGSEVRIKTVELVSPRVNLVRREDGTFELSELLERLRAGDEGGADRRSVRIDEFSIDDGTLRFVDRAAAGGTGIAELSGVSFTAAPVGFGLPLELELRAALESEKPNLRATLQLDALPTTFAALSPEAWPDVQGSLALRRAPIARLEGFLPPSVAALLTGGSVDFDAKIDTDEEARYVLTGRVGGRELLLRGHPAEAGFSFEGAVPKGDLAAMHLDLSGVELKGPGLDLHGAAQLSLEPPTFSFALTGESLDLDALLGALPARSAEPEAPAALVPPSVRARLASLRGEGTLAIEALTRGRLSATDLDARAELRGGTLRLSQASLSLYGGTADLSGTEVNLTQAVPTWELRAAMQGLALEQAMQQLSGHAPLTGALSGSLALDGQGAAWSVIRENVHGTGSVSIANGQLTSGNLTYEVAKELAPALAAVGVDLTKVASGSSTSLGDLTASFRVKNGALQLTRPMTLQTPLGATEVSGAIGLDERLDLQATAALSPAFVSTLTGGKLTPRGPVKLPFSIGGTLEAPAVTGLDTGALAKSLLPSTQLEERITREREGVERRIEREREAVEERARREARRKLEEALPRF